MRHESLQRVIDALLTILARLEELGYPAATLLRHFPRSIQLDSYSCGAKVTWMTLTYFGKHGTSRSVEKELGTTREGTSRRDIKRVLIEHGLTSRVNADMGVRDLKKAVNSGSPVIVSLYDNWHYGVVYGYSARHLFVMNPSLGSMGSFKCAVPLEEWRRIFDRWGIVVSAG